MRRKPRLYSRDGIWWCWFYDHRGKRHRKSTHQRDRALAVEAARRLERDHFAAPDRKALSVEDALAMFGAHIERQERSEATQGYYASKGRMLCRVLGGERDVNDLRMADLERYQDRRTKMLVGKVAPRPVSRHSIAKEIGALLSALRYAKRHGLYQGDVDQLRPDGLDGVYTPRDRALSRDEYTVLWQAMDPEGDRRDYLATLVATGVRLGELFSLRATDLDHARRMLHVRGTKTERSDRWVPLDKDVHAILRRRARAAPAGPLFPLWGNVVRDLARSCARAGITAVTPNDLRRTFASWLCDAGVPELVVAQLMGHSSSAMVRRVYARTGGEAQRRAIDAINLGVTAGVTTTTTTSGRGGTQRTSGTARNTGISVPRPGIEPGTRGFSDRPNNARRPPRRRDNSGVQPWTVTLPVTAGRSR